MQALVDWLGEALADPKPDILAIAAKLHHDFVLIHPFDDGNGRVARMLVNYLFLRDGYSPIIVPTDEEGLPNGATAGRCRRYFALGGFPREAA